MSAQIDILEKLAQGKKERAEKKTAKVAVEATQTVAAPAIKETDIKSNPVYAILVDEKINAQEKLDKLFAFKRYNPALTKEENERNAQVANEFLYYAENQLMKSASKGIDFTNDEAFSLYDGTVRELHGNIKIFKSYIEPFLKALEVLQRAREADIPANELIETVENMRKDIGSMEQELKVLEEKKKSLEWDIGDNNRITLELEEDIQNLADKVKICEENKARAEASWNVFTKNKIIGDMNLEISLYKAEIASMQRHLDGYKKAVSQHNSALSEINDKISVNTKQVEALKDSYNNNEDTRAIAKLVEITGEDFKNKRKEVVTSAQTIVERAVTKIESSIGRFESGKTEAGEQLNVITNLNEMIGLLSTADKKVRVADGDFVMKQKEIVDRIKAEKGVAAVYDPEYEIALKHLTIATDHVAEINSAASRTAALEGKLISQTSTFKGMKDAYEQKRQDATNLRTSAAVDIPAQLAIAVKSVEMATATESNNMVNDAFAELSKTTQQSVSSVFEIVSAGTGQNNEKLRKAFESTMESIQHLNEVEADLRAKTKESYEVRKHLDEAQQALKSVTSAVSSAVVDEENLAIKSGEQQAAG